MTDGLHLFRERQRRRLRGSIVGWWMILIGATVALIALFGVYGFSSRSPWLMSIVWLGYAAYGAHALHIRYRTLRILDRQ